MVGHGLVDEVRSLYRLCKRPADQATAAPCEPSDEAAAKSDGVQQGIGCVRCLAANGPRGYSAQ